MRKQSAQELPVRREILKPYLEERTQAACQAASVLYCVFEQRLQLIFGDVVIREDNRPLRTKVIIGCPSAMPQAMSRIVVSSKPLCLKTARAPSKMRLQVSSAFRVFRSAARTLHRSRLVCL